MLAADAAKYGDVLIEIGELLGRDSGQRICAQGGRLRRTLKRSDARTQSCFIRCMNATLLHDSLDGDSSEGKTRGAQH